MIPETFEGFSSPCWFGRVREEVEATDPEPDPPLPDRALGFARIAARRAWDQSGLGQAGLSPDRIAVIVSSSKGLLSNLLEARGRFLCGGDADLVPPFEAAWGDTPSRRIARDLGLAGPALNYPAACATGIASIVPAIHLLQEGLADAVLAGSAEACGHPLILAGFSSMGAMAAGLSRPFHTDRDGFNPGEGAAVFVLERDRDARRREARPLARIAGWDLRSDAHSATAVEPGGQTLEYAVRRALARAGWAPTDVDYINAHGTGTRLNDTVEAGVIARVFGHPGGHRPPPPVSSLKPYTGHLLGASAAVELALILESLRDGFIPPTLRLDRPDPALPLRHVPPEGIAAPARRILKLSLGFGGHIGVLAVELSLLQMS